MTWVGVGVGSNIDPERHIRLGLADMRRRFGPLVVSTVYASPAVGFAGDDFLNLVVSFVSDRPVASVAAALRAIEAAHRPTGLAPKHPSRALDLDLLLYGDGVLNENGLRIPRVEITRHAFVLAPLAEIAGERRHPLSGITFAQLWARFDRSRASLRPVELAL